MFFRLSCVMILVEMFCKFVRGYVFFLFVEIVGVVFMNLVVIVIILSL